MKTLLDRSFGWIFFGAVLVGNALRIWSEDRGFAVGLVVAGVSVAAAPFVWRFAIRRRKGGRVRR